MNDDGTRRLTKYYVCALSAVALLSIAGQFVVQSQLARQSHDSTVVNLAGRQRMLSQRVGKCAAILAAATPAVDARPYLDELRSTLPIWRRNHLAMQQGDPELGLPGDNSPAVTARFEELNPTFDAVYAAAERLATAAASPGAATAALRDDAAVVLAREADYLRGMDAIVDVYEIEAEGRVRRLQTVERVLLALTLLVLALEGFLIFRPAVLRIRDAIAELHQSHAALRQAKEAAESASRAKSAFLANMSHEIRTPLHAVLGAADYLRQSDDENERRTCVQAIDESGHMLLSLLNDLLDLSKIEAGKFELQPGPVDVRELLTGVTAMLTRAATAKGLDLRLEISADVPRVVTVDALRLRQVLVNLLNNALKFTDAGEIVLRASSQNLQTGSAALRLEVADTGIGIPADEQSRIFAAFTQAKSKDATSRGGVGLGLDIASRLVRMMDGQLSVQSEPGRGSTFAFEIVCPVSEVVDAANAKTEPAQASAGLRILAAEDAPMIRYLLEKMLSAAGHRPVCVANGSEAVSAFEREPFDLVLLDLRMPVLDGLATAATIRAAECALSKSRTPIVALTAATPAEFADDAMPNDFDGYLLKPFTSEALEETVRRFTAPQTGADRTARVTARLQGRTALLRELVELFLQDAPQQMLDMLQACDQDDRRRLKTAVHRLRGQLEMLEVGEAARIARRIENNCDEGRRQSLEEGVASLLAAWPEVCGQVGALIAADADHPSSIASR